MATSEVEVQPAQQLTSLEDYQFTGSDFTVERKCKLITALREYGSIFHAAQATGCSRRAVYDWIEQDEQFAEAVADVREDNYDDLETSVFKRAFKSDLLAMFYLKAHRHKFRDRVSVDVEVVRSEIEERMNQLQLRQLPAMTTEFLSGADNLHSEALNTLQIPQPSARIQKEGDTESSSE